MEQTKKSSQNLPVKIFKRGTIQASVFRNPDGWLVQIKKFYYLGKGRTINFQRFHRMHLLIKEIRSLALVTDALYKWIKQKKRS